MRVILLRNGITDLSFNVHLVQPSPDFEAMVSGSAPQDTRLTAAYAEYAPLRQYLAMASIQPADVLVASVFTVGDGERLVKSPGAIPGRRPARAPAADPFLGEGAAPAACRSPALMRPLGPRAWLRAHCPRWDEWLFAG